MSLISILVYMFSLVLLSCYGFTGVYGYGWLPPHKLWPNATIPYTISIRYTTEMRTVIAKAFDHIQNHSCIRFVKRDRFVHKHYIYITTNGSGCASYTDDCIDMELNCARHGSQSCKDANDVYRGIKRTTISGKTCQFWNKNPGGSKEAPWCYTMDPETEWEYCFPECKTYHSGNAIRRRRSMEHPVQAVPLKTLPTYLPTFETYQEEILNAKSLSEINSNYSHFEGDIVGITVDTIDEKVRLTNKADKFLHPLVAAKIDVAVAPGSRAAATTDPMKLWKEGVVPWEIYADYLTPAKALIASDVFNEAFRQIQELTCIQFVEVDHSIHQDYIYLAPNGTGCASYVGRRGGKQVVSLDATCLDLDTVLHELMHALGFVHEHSRPDRDEHIKIYWENVDKKEQDNFKKYNLNRISILGAPYDYNSVMHYGRKEFTFNGAYDTLRPKKCDREAVVLGPGNRGLSYYDAYKINKLYNCSMVQDDCINATGNCAKAGSVACRNSDLYKTIKRTTVTGRSCQPWDSQYPHKHQYSSYYGSTNYCRNPNGIKAAPWCLTMDPNTRWEYCFPQCDLSSAGDLLARLVVDAEERIDQAFGRLEVYHRGIWGTVAAEHNEQNRKLGAVVCRMLGLPSDNPIIYGSDKFGMGYGPIWLYNVSCDGTEHHIENCSNFQVQNWKIRHSKDIGLHCSCPNIVSVSGSVAAEIDFTTNEIIKTGNVTLRSTGNSIASGIDWGHGMKLEFYLQPTVPAKKRLVMLIEHAKNDNSSVVVRFNGQDNFEHRKSYDPILESAEDVYFVPGRFVKIGKCNEILIYNFNTLRKRYLIKKIKLVV